MCQRRRFFLGHPSKGSKIDYGTRLSMQNYLKPNNILTFQEQIEIFSYRSEMNELIFNFKGLKDNELCVCTIQLNNHHIFQCGILNEFKDHELNYIRTYWMDYFTNQRRYWKLWRKILQNTEKLPWQLEPTIDYCFN